MWLLLTDVSRAYKFYRKQRRALVITFMSISLRDVCYLAATEKLAVGYSFQSQPITRMLPCVTLQD
jgi:hypothetical protein